MYPIRAAVTCCFRMELPITRAVNWARSVHWISPRIPMRSSYSFCCCWGLSSIMICGSGLNCPLVSQQPRRPPTAPPRWKKGFLILLWRNGAAQRFISKSKPYPQQYRGDPPSSLQRKQVHLQLLLPSQNLLLWTWSADWQTAHSTTSSHRQFDGPFCGSQVQCSVKHHIRLYVPYKVPEIQIISS